MTGLACECFIYETLKLEFHEQSSNWGKEIGSWKMCDCELRAVKTIQWINISH